jgi:hypothetical protein
MGTGAEWAKYTVCYQVMITDSRVGGRLRTSARAPAGVKPSR